MLGISALLNEIGASEMSLWDKLGGIYSTMLSRLSDKGVAEQVTAAIRSGRVMRRGGMADLCSVGELSGGIVIATTSQFDRARGNSTKRATAGSGRSRVGGERCGGVEYGGRGTWPLADAARLLQTACLLLAGEHGDKGV